MSAERLRDAAKVLRDAARGAQSAVGGSTWRVDTGYYEGLGMTYDVAPAEPFEWRTAVSQFEEVATYIATMHPGVGLAFADLLEATAPWLDLGTGAPSYVAKVNALSDAILGGA